MAISAAELELYRNILEQTLLTGDDAVVQQRSWVPDNMGGGSYSWSTLASGVSYRLVPREIGMREEMAGGKVVVHDVFECSLHWDQEIDEAMRVVIGDDTFEIAHVDDNFSQRLTRTADVVRVR